MNGTNDSMMVGQATFLQNLNDCGCCQGITVQTPVEITNRSELTAVAYRVGTHARFKMSMQARLSAAEFPALKELRTREQDDFAIALLDSWATVADVLTFYQERIANESFLRTATERRSLLELARLVGYELGPGVAASTYLAFTLEEALGAPEQAVKQTIIDIGTKVQSIPGPGEKPQTFETIEKIEARVAWNKLRPHLTQPQDLGIYSNELYILGTNDNLVAGTQGVIEIPMASLYLVGTGITFEEGTNSVLAYKLKQIYLKGTATNLKAGERLLVVGKQGATKIDTAVLHIYQIQPEPELDRTRIDLDENPQLPSFAQPVAKGLAKPVATSIGFGAAQANSLIVKKTWKENDLNAFLLTSAWKAEKVTNFVNSPPIPKLPTPDQGIFAFRQRLGFFGHNAPRWNTLPKSQRFGEWVSENNTSVFKDGAYKLDWDANGGRSIRSKSQGGDYTDSHVYFERCVPEVVTNSWAVFDAPGIEKAYRIAGVGDESLADYGLSAKATGLTLKKADDGELGELSDFKVRKTTAYIQSEGLVLADLPVSSDVVKGSQEVMLDNMVLGLQSGRNLIVSGERADAPGLVESEVVVLADVFHTGGFTVLRFKEGLEYAYLRKTLTINANVARATHGETVEEILGHGNASQPYQRFTLRQPPLTHVSSPTPTGTQSTLEVRVNDILWKEAPTLYGRNPHDHVFTARNDDEGKTTVQFGDGVCGARLATGQNNVRVTYRKGIGLEGLVKAGQLTLLITRPLGVKEVTNPLDATGAADPESRDDARKNAPLTVLTLDRLVSLRDYEDSARAFAGIAKALATWMWEGQAHGIFITVGGPNGAAIEESGATYENLLKAIRNAGDPHVRFRVKTYRPALFRIVGKIKVDEPAFLREKVMANIEQALREQFSFDARAFGQPVMSSEVIAVIQAVPGVVAVDLDELYRTDGKEPLGHGLPAALPEMGAEGEIPAAELLTLDTAPLEELVVMS